MKRLKSFTTMELSIVMLLSAIISGMAYNGYLLFIKQISVYQKTNDEALQIQQILKLLKNDTYLCNTISATENELTFSFLNSSIAYTFNENFILRTQASTIDSFKLNCSDYWSSFNNIKNNAVLSTVDAFGFILTYKKEISPILFTKNYGNKNRIEEELKNGY